MNHTHPSPYAYRDDRKYKNGAIGSFVHAVALQGTAYSCELEVICDGFQMRLVDPYNAPVLYLRRPGDDIEERHAVSVTRDCLSDAMD
jgi:hypothetical protein